MGMTFDHAMAAHTAGDFATAERGYLGLLDQPRAVHNLAVLYRYLGRLDEAAPLLRRIVDEFPEAADDRRALAITLLALRRYAEAWPLYESRRGLPGLPEPRLPFPEWRGESLAGKRLLVTPEQGLGDLMMMGRYIAPLKARAEAEGGQVVVGCPPALVRLFEGCGFEVSLGPTLSAADLWTPANSLPWRLGAEPPKPPVYIPTRASGAQGGIGVTVAGNRSHSNDHNRSLDPESAAVLRALGRDLAPEATGARDLQDPAEIVAGLDLVITVDTSLAHLAGAMGKPCWVLLPALGLDWRWNDGLHSDWYPQARLFRQEVAGDWAGVLDRVRAALSAAG